MTHILIKALLCLSIKQVRFLPICLLNIPKYFQAMLAGQVAKSVNMGNGKLEKVVQWKVYKPTPEFS